MDTTGEGSTKKGKRRKDKGKAPAKKRPTRTRKPTSVTHLVQQLHQTVFPSTNTQATRHQVLHRTRDYILELEKTLDSLLKMRGHFKAEDGGSSSLKDVKEEYMQMTFYQEQGGAPANPVATSESERMFWHLQSDFDVELEEAVEELLTDKPQTPEPLTSPELIEFERYLHFYKHMMDMLTESHMVSPEQIAQPVVSKVVANLWQDLKREGNSSIYQYGIPQAQSTPCFFTFLPDLVFTDGGAKESSTGSQEATSSFLSSTPEEILFEDAFDVASDFLNHGAIQTTSSPSGLHDILPWESPEGNLYLYQQIYDFLRSSLTSYTKMSSQQFDYETMFLRCTESFDDEDDL